MVIKPDCTLRGGGYLNTWDLQEDLIRDYLDAKQSAGVDIVEVIDVLAP